MPFRYELRLGARTITGSSRPCGLDQATSAIAIDAPTSVYLFIQAHEIFATARIEENLEIFTSDNSTLVIENFYSKAAGSKIYIQDSANPHSHIEYINHEIAEQADNEQASTMVIANQAAAENIDTIESLINSAKKSYQDAKTAKHDAEQALYKVLFKKDNFASGAYKISYDHVTKTYAANDQSMDFVAIAKKNFQEAKAALENSEDMGAEISFLMFDQAIESMTRERASTMFFLANGKRSFLIKYLTHTGDWVYHQQDKKFNYLQVATTQTAEGKYGDEHLPLYTAYEIYNIRQKTILAVVDFEKTHGNRHELIFNFSNAAHQEESQGLFTETQSLLLSAVRGNTTVDSEKKIKEINENFPDTGQEFAKHGIDFQQSLVLLKKYATLKAKEKFADLAFHDVDEETGAYAARIYPGIRHHLECIKEQEINEQHHQQLIDISAALDSIKKIELAFTSDNGFEDYLVTDQPVEQTSNASVGENACNDGSENRVDDAAADLVGLMADTADSPY